MGLATVDCDKLGKKLLVCCFNNLRPSVFKDTKLTLKAQMHTTRS